MHRRDFLISACAALTGSLALLLCGSCVAPLISPAVSEKKAQAWRCGNCGHLTRSDQDLTDKRCPRCRRKGFLTKITEQELQDFLKQYNAA